MKRQFIGRRVPHDVYQCHKRNWLRMMRKTYEMMGDKAEEQPPVYPTSH